MKATLINLTSNSIAVPGYGEIEPSGFVARLNSHLATVGDVNGIPILAGSTINVVNLPEPQEGCYYIVPAVVRSYCKDRKDLLSPCKLMRDNRGTVTGCSAFEVNP